MVKMVLVCDKCKKSFLTTDGGCLTINFDKKVFEFSCPGCGHCNVFDFGEIKNALDRKTKLPSLGASRF